VRRDQLHALHLAPFRAIAQRATDEIETQGQRRKLNTIKIIRLTSYTAT
jgi:hypothetical protein